MYQGPEGIGRLEAIFGCMYAGKSEELIRRLKHARYAKKEVIAFKPVIDNRYSDSNIVSHDGISFTALPIQSVIDIYDLSKSADVIGIDEIQFFDSMIIEVIQELNKEGKHVIISGLELDYLGQPFGVTPTLIALADTITKVYAVCTICGSSATRTQRVVSNTEKVLVGSYGVYEARCRAHFVVPDIDD